MCTKWKDVRNERKIWMWVASLSGSEPQTLRVGIWLGIWDSPVDKIFSLSNAHILNYYHQYLSTCSSRITVNLSKEELQANRTCLVLPDRQLERNGISVEFEISHHWDSTEDPRVGYQALLWSTRGSIPRSSECHKWQLLALKHRRLWCLPKSQDDDELSYCPKNVWDII